MDKDKQEFWEALRIPANRGCWNCVNEELFCHMECNAFTKPPSSDDLVEYLEEMEDDRWLINWEWNGQR